MTLFGDWQRGPAIINQAIEQNPYYNALFTTPYGSIGSGREDTNRPTGNPTLQKTLAVLGSVAEGRKFGFVGENRGGVQAVKICCNANPTFRTRGRVLIKHYIKFDEIVAKVIQGLKEVGIDVA
jgi:adenylate cyclase